MLTNTRITIYSLIITLLIGCILGIFVLFEFVPLKSHPIMFGCELMVLALIVSLIAYVEERLTKRTEKKESFFLNER